MSDRELQDSDFEALTLLLEIDFYAPNDVYPDDLSEFPWGKWEFDKDDEVHNEALVRAMTQRCASAFSPWGDHFLAAGWIRADGLRVAGQGPEGDTMTCEFYLVCRASDDGGAMERLATIRELKIDVPEIPGAMIAVTARTDPINATLLFEAARANDFNVGPAGGASTPDLRPAPGETREQWLARVSFSAKRLVSAAERWEISGRNPIIFRAYGDRSERASQGTEIDWLVPGIIPRGCLTLLTGSSSVGKSSMVHSWIAALGCTEPDRYRSVLGMEVAGNFVCALIAGEDTGGIIEYRAERHSRLWGRSRYLPLFDLDMGLTQYLDQLRGMPVLDLVAVDPVRAFFSGDENSAIAVEQFCHPLAALAREKNCAVVLVHHVTKGSGEPRSLAELKGRTRGSSAFIDSSRMTIGAVRRAKGTVEVGPVKYNFPSEEVWLSMGQGAEYWPDPETFTLQPVGDRALGATVPAAPPQLRVLAAVTRCNRAGTIVRKSGKYGLFESKAPDLAGLSRSTILEAIAELVGGGELADGEAGLIARQWRAGTGDG